MKTILASLILLFSTALFAQEPPEKYQKIWDNLNEGDSEYAQKELEKILKKNPKDPWPYWMMGLSMTFSPAHEEGITYFEKAIAVDSTFAPAYYNLATSLDETDSLNHQRIEYNYTKAIELLPNENHYYVARGGLYLDQKKYTLAIADAEKAKSIVPEDCWFANQIIVKALHEQNKVSDLKRFLAVNDPNMGGGPEDPDYQYLLATIYESFGQQEKACAAYKQALTEQESYDELFSDMGEEAPAQPEWIETAKKKAKKCR